MMNRPRGSAGGLNICMPPAFASAAIGLAGPADRTRALIGDGLIGDGLVGDRLVGGRTAGAQAALSASFICMAESGGSSPPSD